MRKVSALFWCLVLILSACTPREYSYFDKLASGYTLGSWPFIGYVLFFVAVVLLAYHLVKLLTGNSVKALLVCAVAGSATALWYLFLPSVGFARYSLVCVLPILWLIWGVFQNRMVRPKPILVLRRKDGTSITYLSKPFNPPDQTKDIELDEVNGDIRLRN